MGVSSSFFPPGWVLVPAPVLREHYTTLLDICQIFNGVNRRLFAAKRHKKQEVERF
jgi:hypothetical protein